MKVAIHQPQYLPWLGYFDKMDQADIFVLLDSVQFKKNEWQNRNRIKTAQGWQWLTVPVIHKFPQRINDVEINNQADWQRKHLRALEMNYAKAPFLAHYWREIETALSHKWERLADLNIHLVELLAKSLGLNRLLIRGSDLKVRESPTERLIDICKSLGADTYLAGRDGHKYLGLEAFRREKIHIIFQDYQHPEYPHLHGKFEPFMSVVDLIFNHGDKSLSILRHGSRWKEEVEKGGSLEDTSDRCPP